MKLQLSDRHSDRKSLISMDKPGFSTRFRRAVSVAGTGFARNDAGKPQGSAVVCRCEKRRVLPRAEAAGGLSTGIMAAGLEANVHKAPLDQR